MKRQARPSLYFVMERFLLLLLSLLASFHGFNIDTNNLVVQKGPRDSCDDCMFGFSVAQHKEGGVPW